MKISVIVPAFNEEKLLGATLRSINTSLAAFDERGWAHELIVCDNNSTDRTAALAAAAGARVVFEPVNQIARARNAGAAAATGDWLIFVDADSQPTPELFADVAEAIRDGACLAGSVTLRMEFPGVMLMPRLILGFWNLLSRVRRLLGGPLIFCEAAAFRQVGGFEERLYFTEDIDVSLRFRRLARERGRRVVILHRHPLLTSSRRVQLYSIWRYLGFFLRIAWTRGAVLKQRETCPMWYEGKR